MDPTLSQGPPPAATKVLTLARRRYERGDLDDALYTLAEIAGDTDARIRREGLALIGDILAHKGRLPEALWAYDEASALDPANVDAQLGRGAAWALALAWLSRACSLGDPSPEVVKQFLETAAELDRLDEVVPVLRDYVPRHPEQTELGCALAAALVRLDRPVEAAVACQRVLRTDPGHEQANELLRRVVEAQKESAGGRS